MLSSSKPRPAAILAAAALGALTIYTIAGPLDPPAGPIGPVYKTLSEIEPRTMISATTTPGDADSLFKITQPGSYYLTGNITGVAAKAGIEIASSGVTLDLRGFTLIGVPGSLDAVSVPAVQTNVTIQNGAVRSWGKGGIGGYPVGPTLHNSQVFGINALNNGEDGIDVGIGCTVRDCAAQGNLLSGIGGDKGTTVVHCAANSNSWYGIVVNFAGTVSQCTAVGNGGSGIIVGYNTSISDSVARQNGFLALGASPGAQPKLRPQATPSRSAGGRAFLDDDGIFVYGYCTVTNCASTENADNGIEAWSGDAIIGCTALQNGNNGIFCPFGCNVRSSNAQYNNNDGIQIFESNYVADCNCDYNDFDGDGIGSGINVTSYGNRIEANHVAHNGLDGILVAFPGNSIIRNSAFLNTADYVIAPGNVFGPIVTAATVGAILNPHANYVQ